MIKLADLFFTRNPAKSWNELAQRELIRSALVEYDSDADEEPMIELRPERVTPPMFERTTLIGMPFLTAPNLKRAGAR